MINKVNDSLLRQFVGLYCLSKLIISVPHDVFLISLLFRIVSRVKHIHLPLFMIDKVYITLLREFICFYCLFNRIICLNHNVFLISLVFRIVSSLNHFHLHLFMIVRVNLTLVKQFVCLYYLFKRTICLNHDVFLILLLFRIVSSLNHIHLPIFMINKENITLLTQFLCFYCLFKSIIWLNHDVF